MKTKFILGSLVLAATFVGCSNEELGNVAENENQSGMIELSENFMIGTIGVNGVESRTHWELVENGTKLRNFFAPVVVTEGNNMFGDTPVQAPAIGLCWIGQSLGANVYTNYEFIHNGWLAEDADEAIFGECDGELKTGWTYDQMSTTATEGVEAYGDNIKLNPETKKYEDEEFDAINYNSGVFKTENKSIFGGQYIAYYPYNPNFIEAGTIPAVSKVEFDNVAESNLNSMDIAENTFRYTNVATIEGGAKAEGFSFNNLSGVLRISLQNIGGSNQINAENVMLYSASEGFLKEVRLSASAIAAGKKGAELYAEVVKKSKTIMINAEEYFGVAHSDGTVDSHAIYITALPTTISDLKVMLYDNGTDKWAEYNVGELVIPAGGSKGITLTVKDTDFKAVSYASNAATLRKALAKEGTKDAPKTVKILGDITLEMYSEEQKESGAYTIPAYVTVEGDKIIVPEDCSLSVTNNAVLKSDVEVLGQSCCAPSTRAGKLVATNGSKIDGDVYIRKGAGETKLNGRLETAKAEYTANSTISVEGDVFVVNETVIKGAMNVASSGKVTVSYNEKSETAGTLYFKGATLENNGVVEVLTNAKFNMLSATGSSTLAAGANFTNNGKFIDNINAVVGAATQGMINNGDYICKVADQARLAEAYANKKACNIIEFVNEKLVEYNLGVAQAHNGAQVDLIVNSENGTKFGTSNGATATVGNVEVNDKLTIAATTSVNGAGTVWGYITVDGDINVNASLELEENVRNFKADNLYVNKAGSATFGNRNGYTKKTMEVAGTIEVKKDAVFTITKAAAGKTIALVTCTELVEGGTFVGQPELVD